MTEEEKKLGSRWFEEVWNKGRREAVVELLAPDAVVHEAGGDAVGPEGFYPFFDRMNNALSKIHVTIQDTIIGEDKICLRWECEAMHTGDGLGMPPTGKRIHVTGMSIMRVANGRLAEGWQNWDMLGMLEQIKGARRAATFVA